LTRESKELFSLSILISFFRQVEITQEEEEGRRRRLLKKAWQRASIVHWVKKRSLLPLLVSDPEDHKVILLYSI